MMDEKRSWTLSIFEWIGKIMDVDGIKNQALKVCVSLLAFPLAIFFIFLALVIEEPIKCVFYIITRQYSIREVWLHYKRCWARLFGGH